MVKIGIAGIGMMGTMHIGAYQKLHGVKLAAIYDRDPKKAAGDFSGTWGNIEGGATRLDMAGVIGTTRFEDLLEMKELDALDVCLPTPFHAEHAIAALEAGKHVLCEKPLARTSAEAQKIADAAAKSDRIFMPAMCMRFWPHWAWLKRAVGDKRYGNVLAASFYRTASMPPGWFSNGNWSGGAILDLHIHDTDFIAHLFGPPAAVFSRGYSKTSGCIDHIATQYIYEGPDAPPLVTAHGGWCMADGFAFTMRYNVNFEHATAVFDIANPKLLQIAREGKLEEIKLEGDGYQAELAYFVECVANKKQPTVVTAKDAVQSIRIVEAEQRSVETGTVVRV